MANKDQPLGGTVGSAESEYITVQEGDGYDRIARRHLGPGASVQDVRRLSEQLADYNGGALRSLQPGQTLGVPPADWNVSKETRQAFANEDAVYNKQRAAEVASTRLRGPVAPDGPQTLKNREKSLQLDVTRAGISYLASSLIGKDGYDVTDPAPNARGGPRDGRGPLKGRFTWKCNQFVHDVLSRAGAAPPEGKNGEIPLAKDWGDSNQHIKNWRPVPTNQIMPGDVISDGHHVGIYGGDRTTISAATPGHAGWDLLGGVTRSDWGFRTPSGEVQGDILARRYDPRY